jgi:UTP--glucose-1-phosphate uridylyltransferase
MGSPVRKAVIPAAGLGTRFLPATKAQSKEMLPVVDKPAIQYAVEEAARASLRDVLIITGRGKRALEDHFDRSFELEHYLEERGKTADLDEMRAIADLAKIHYVRQPEPKGLGHAVGVAREHVGDSPFAVLLPDDLFTHRSTLLADMVAAHERLGASVIALRRCEPSEISLYGCVRPEEVEPGIVRVHDIVEKPAPEDAPSDLGVMGRYVFTPEIFDAIDKVKPGKGGEIQLTDAIGILGEDQPVYGLIFETGRYDVGNKLDYLRATVEIALDRPDLGPEFREFLVDLAKRENLG